MAYSVALKHWLRFEPAIAYKDLVALVGHINTFAGEALDEQEIDPPKKTPWKAAGEYLGLSFASSNPRKLMKRAKKPVGHLPLEILNHLSAYIDSCVEKKLLPSAIHQGQLGMKTSRQERVLTAIETVADWTSYRSGVIERGSDGNRKSSRYSSSRSLRYRDLPDRLDLYFSATLSAYWYPWMDYHSRVYR